MENPTSPQIALGTMYFGTRQSRDEAFPILDRFVDLGGTWLDTADNYAFWRDDTGFGGASERMLGDWLAANPGTRELVLISTKVGADPLVAGSWPESMEGLAPAVIDGALTRSLERLGTDHVDLYWAHVEDRSVPLDDQVAAFGAVVADGRARRIGASNHASWRVERARSLATASGVEPYTAVRLRQSYLQPVSFAELPDGGHTLVTPESLDFVRSENLALWAYSTLLSGAYAHPDRPLPAAYAHPGTERRRAAVDAVAREAGATANQVVLAWLLGGSPAITPIVGVSSVAQLDEVMAARDVRLSAEQRNLLDSVS